MTLFKSYRESIIIKDHVEAQHIIVGDYSYYSGYYHDKSFEDCVMYLDAEAMLAKAHEKWDDARPLDLYPAFQKVGSIV